MTINTQLLTTALAPFQSTQDGPTIHIPVADRPTTISASTDEHGNATFRLNLTLSDPNPRPPATPTGRILAELHLSQGGHLTSHEVPDAHPYFDELRLADLTALAGILRRVQTRADQAPITDADFHTLLEELHAAARLNEATARYTTLREIAWQIEQLCAQPGGITATRTLIITAMDALTRPADETDAVVQNLVNESAWT